jgi:hypothetical protein
VGYWKTMTPNRSTTFEGFCLSASDYGGSQYQSFKFAKADAAGGRGPQVRARRWEHVLAPKRPRLALARAPAPAPVEPDT